MGYPARKMIFQSTLPRGERRVRNGCGYNDRVISIHAPTGGATDFREIYDSLTRISIHAPTGGATILRLPKGIQILLFQSTLPRGERPLRCIRFSRLSQFQSTLPRGERRQVWHLPKELILNFNPRSHGGSDVSARLQSNSSLYISIHAPTGGATSHKYQGAALRPDFNPRSHGGSDLQRSADRKSKL